MDNTMLHALKSLVDQVNSTPASLGLGSDKDHADRVRIAEVRGAAEEAKDNLRHGYGR